MQYILIICWFTTILNYLISQTSSWAVNNSWIYLGTLFLLLLWNKLWYSFKQVKAKVLKAILLYDFPVILSGFIYRILGSFFINGLYN
jgi:predicted membrane channel-forming protein YqfA (hemolysin III family)